MADAMQVIEGSCHCGNLTLRFATAKAPAELPVRTCGCTFCRRHGGRYTSDPAGRVVIQYREEAELGRYRFGTKTADFLLCRRCGVFLAAYMPEGLAVINILGFEEPGAFTGAPTQLAYDGEVVETRLARRARSWTPAELRRYQGVA